MPGEQNVQFRIKIGKETEFNNLIEKKVLPILRKQNGFQEEVTFVSPKGANYISLWDNRQNAEGTPWDGVPDRTPAFLVRRLGHCKLAR